METLIEKMYVTYTERGRVEGVSERVKSKAENVTESLRVEGVSKEVRVAESRVCHRGW